MVLAALCAAPSAWAASQTWTNAPADAIWLNVNNWINKAVPGAINLTGNSVNNDTATFNSPVPASGIGSATMPIALDDATIAGDRSRQIGSIVFDTADCGAYVFSSPSLAALPTASTPETGILNVSHNGSIRLNAAVTNSQVFLVPILTRLPSSTDGIYNLVNNATAASATLFLAAVTNNSSDTRGTTFVLDGTNTGTNTIASLSQSPTYTTGISGLRKQGTGTWILSGPNYFRATSPINIWGGTLIVRDAGAFGAATAATVSNATLRV
ncbi:MAG TPA: hypothetical protein VNZ22_09375, partial [Bacillota bacterium]|nr:hypothetical protein [Bacillota bacterium]